MTGTGRGTKGDGREEKGKRKFEQPLRANTGQEPNRHSRPT